MKGAKSRSGEREERVGRALIARGDDISGDELAPFLRRCAHDGDFGHVRMSEEHVFDLARVDV